MRVNLVCAARNEQRLLVAEAVLLGDLAERLQERLACNDLLLAHGVTNAPDVRASLMQAITSLRRTECDLLRVANDVLQLALMEKVS